jgi:hypothetical protein
MFFPAVSPPQSRQVDKAIHCCAFYAATPCASWASHGANLPGNCGNTTKRWRSQKLSFDFTGSSPSGHRKTALFGVKTPSRSCRPCPPADKVDRSAILLHRLPASRAALNFLCVKTMKYRPSYPQRPFENLLAARQWVGTFVHWYNENTVTAPSAS